MAYLHWTSDLNTGIDVIDHQHQRIVEYINELYEADAAGNRDGVKHVVNELVDYTLTHFAFEEDLQERAQYPFIKAHKRVHEIFTKRVGEFLERANKGEDVTQEVLSMLKIWLVNHIRGDDADYAECVKELLEKEGHAMHGEHGWLSTTLKKFFG